MQTFFRKTSIYFFCLCLISIQFAYSQANKSWFEQGDFFYKSNKFEEADSIYKFILKKKIPVHPVIYKKLANISLNKKNKDIVEALYFLNLYNLKKPSEENLEEMSKIADENSLNGFENDNFNLVFLIYKKYIPYFLIFLILLVFFIQFTLLQRVNSKEKIQLRHFLILSLLILGITFIANIDNGISDIILNKDNVFLREAPNASSKTLLTLNKGTKLNIIGQDDIWLRVLVERKIYYINQSEAFIIK